MLRHVETSVRYEYYAVDELQARPEFRDSSMIATLYVRNYLNQSIK